MIYDSLSRYRMGMDHYRREIEKSWNLKHKEIEDHPETWRVDPSNIDKSFSYVSNIFPDLEDGIYNTRCYSIGNSYFWKRKLNLPSNAAGIYAPAVGVVLLNVTPDIKLNWADILVHELLHRASHLLGHLQSERIEEEFAFSYSMEWFKRNYSKEFVLENYLMPYCTYESMIECNVHNINDIVIEKAKRMSERLFKFKTGDVVCDENTKMGLDIWDTI